MEPICGFRLQGDPRPCPSLLKVVFQVIPASPGMAKLKRFEEQRAATTVPLGRAGRLREVGYLALYLASAASDYMTGQTIVLDGGLGL